MAGISALGCLNRGRGDEDSCTVGATQLEAPQADLLGLAMAEFPTLVVRNYSELVDALVAVKNHLQISNETLEEITGMTAGGADKYLGLSRQKGIGPVALDMLLGGLAIRLRVEPDLEQAKKMERRWEARNQAQVRQRLRISRRTIELCRPIILSEVAKKGWASRRQRAQAARSPAAPAVQQAAPSAA